MSNHVIKRVLIPDIGNICKWDNVNELKKIKKYENFNFEKIRSCMNQTPDLSELICTCARSVPYDFDKKIVVKEKVLNYNDNYSLKSRIVFFINVTPRGCVTIGLYNDNQETKYDPKLDSEYIHVYPLHPPPIIKKTIVMKKYWEPKNSDGTPRGTYWKTSSILEFYEKLVDLKIVDDFSINIQMFIISNI